MGTISGVFIFIGSFDIMSTSVQNGIWSGVAGVIITLATAQQVVREFRALFKKQVEPIQAVQDSAVPDSAQRR